MYMAYFAFDFCSLTDKRRRDPAAHEIASCAIKQMFNLVLSFIMMMMDCILDEFEIMSKPTNWKGNQKGTQNSWQVILASHFGRSQYA